jgi:hypothetical protein
MRRSGTVGCSWYGRLHALDYHYWLDNDSVDLVTTITLSGTDYILKASLLDSKNWRVPAYQDVAKWELNLGPGIPDCLEFHNLNVPLVQGWTRCGGFPTLTVSGVDITKVDPADVAEECPNNYEEYCPCGCDTEHEFILTVSGSKYAPFNGSHVLQQSYTIPTKSNLWNYYLRFPGWENFGYMYRGACWWIGPPVSVVLSSYYPPIEMHPRMEMYWDEQADRYTIAAYFESSPGPDSHYNEGHCVGYFHHLTLQEAVEKNCTVFDGVSMGGTSNQLSFNNGFGDAVGPGVSYKITMA